MARIDPPADDNPELAELFALTEQVMGFVPNSMRTMSRVPGLVEGFQALAAPVFMNQLISPALTQMVAHIASSAAGCRYCQAHTGHSAERLGVDADKLAALWTFESSELFDDAERAALRLAFHASSVPNVATDDDVEACRAHFSDDQITAIVATISLFGYLNRWNDTMATDLESSPTSFGERVLATNGWEAGKHGG